ncbi:MAG: C_GCAxxG_C_C family protein [Magnetospirillum sp.]|nr:C_GCAxxG_C_C family protein [Magnetospirillum sp.]
MSTDDREAAAAQAERRAFEMELAYGCCPQCVLAAVKETAGAGITDETIKASHGLSGGGALMGSGACGALTGGLVALGAKKGRDADKLDKGRGMANFNAGKQLVDRFRAEFGGVTCQELQQEFTGRTWDLWNAAEYKGFSDARGEKCARASALVARWVVEML